jgi:molecular chaperone DnaK (HSP70)
MLKLTVPCLLWVWFLLPLLGLRYVRVKPTIAVRRGLAIRGSLGIDLGTTFSLCSAPDKQGTQVRIVPIEGARLLSSEVTVLPDGGARVSNPFERGSATLSSMKRVIGKSAAEVLKMKERSFKDKLDVPASGDLTQPAQFHSGQPARPRVSPEDVAACIIRKLVSAAEAQLSHGTSTAFKVDNAVITVPAYFSPAQRSATERAGHLAGLKKVKLLKEPEAAALAHGLNLRIPQLVLVFDLGGGTLDVSVVEVGGGLLEVIATAGDPYLGGDDIDLLIADWLWTQHAQHYGEASSVRAKEDPAARREMLSQARQLKESLSSEHGGVTVPLPSFAEQSNAASVTLTRRALENMCKPLLARMLLPLREVAMAAGINLQGDSAQAGVGGTESHENSSGENDVRSLREIQRGGKVTARLPREVRGDSYRELKRLRGQSQTTNNGGLSMFPAGRSVDALLLVGGATRMPCVRRAVETVTGLVAVSDTRVNPDEAVCLGAGIMAGMLDGVIPGMQVVSHWQSAMLRFLDEEKLKGNDLFPRSS